MNSGIRHVRLDQEGQPGAHTGETMLGCQHGTVVVITDWLDGTDMATRVLAMLYLQLH
jgi:hypothetical protein